MTKQPKKTKPEIDVNSHEYLSTLAELKRHIRECRLRANKDANRELVHLYWTVGKIIVERQKNSGWGGKFIDQLKKDLHNEFQGIKGFARVNIFRMRTFYRSYPLVPSEAEQIDELAHLIILMENYDTDEERVSIQARYLSLVGAEKCFDL
jgi:DUF1016 N-terminal domain